MLKVFQKIYLGSPPLARGVQAMIYDIPDNNGITPACAGSTWVPVSIGGGSEDHPRLRGEYAA